MNSPSLSEHSSCFSLFTTLYLTPTFWSVASCEQIFFLPAQIQIELFPFYSLAQLVVMGRCFLSASPVCDLGRYDGCIFIWTYNQQSFQPDSPISKGLRGWQPPDSFFITSIREWAAPCCACNHLTGSLHSDNQTQSDFSHKTHCSPLDSSHLFPSICDHARTEQILLVEVNMTVLNCSFCRGHYEKILILLNFYHQVLYI